MLLVRSTLRHMKPNVNWYDGLDYPVMSFWSSAKDLDVHATSVLEFTVQWSIHRVLLFNPEHMSTAD